MFLEIVQDGLRQAGRSHPWELQPLHVEVNVDTPLLKATPPHQTDSRPNVHDTVDTCLTGSVTADWTPRCPRTADEKRAHNLYGATGHLEATRPYRLCTWAANLILAGHVKSQMS